MLKGVWTPDVGFACGFSYAEKRKRVPTIARVSFGFPLEMTKKGFSKWMFSFLGFPFKRPKRAPSQIFAGSRSNALLFLLLVGRVALRK